MVASKPITKAQRAKVVELCEAGKGRNDISRATGVSLGTVSKIVKDAGLSFDRSATKAATDARKTDLRARRVELATLLIEDAHRLREQLWQPTKVYNIGGKDNIYTEHAVDQPPFESQLKIVQAAGAAIAKHLDLERHDADQKAGAAKSMLTELGKALGLRVDDAAA